jgi:hypothetical protein
MHFLKYVKECLVILLFLAQIWEGVTEDSIQLQIYWAQSEWKTK